MKEDSGKEKIPELKRQLAALKKDLGLSDKENLKARLTIADLRQKLEVKQLDLDLCREIGTVTGSGFQLRRLLDRIMDRVMQITDTESGTLFLMDECKTRLMFFVIKGPSSEKLEGKQMPVEEGVAGWVSRTGRPYLTHEPTLDKRWSNRMDKETGFQTRDLLAVPLVVHGEVMGVLEILNKRSGQQFAKSDLELLTILSSQIAIIIENARLFLSAQEKVEQFAALTELSGILNSSLDAKTVRTLAMEAVVKLLRCETGSLYLIDEARGELYFEVALGEKGEVLKEIRMKIGEGISGIVAQTGKPELIPDCSADPRWASKVDQKSKFQTRNMVTVPVKSKDKIVGVLQAINKLEDKLFSVEDLHLMESLADQVAIALENARLYEKQKVTFLQTAMALATAIEKRDIYTGGHTMRVRDFSMAIANYMKLTAEQKECLELAAILHDVGKIGIDDEVLRKPGKLTDEEYAKIKAHPDLGYDIMQHIDTLKEVIPGMRYHHERPDGRGYPHGMKDGSIPLLARIIAVADTWDAMTSDRPYRKGLPEEVALKELRKFSGTQFDEVVVKAFFKAYKKGEIMSQHRRPEQEDKKARG